MKISLGGTFFGNTGYARHTRSIANALNDLGHDIRIDTQKPQQWEREVNDFELQALSKPFDPEAISIFIGQPPYWPILLAEKPKKFVGYLVWEGDKIPDYWCEYIKDDRVDLIFIPSKHTYNAVLKTLKGFFLNGDNSTDMQKEAFKSCLNKIRMVPEGYNPAKFYKTAKADDVFTFISNKGWARSDVDRGGIQFLLKAFSEEFNKDEAVTLKVKLNTAYNPPGWKLDNEIKKLELSKDRPKILTMCSNLDDNGLRNFYNEGDVFITTSMAEGFNLPALEAMGCGLPVITTNFGGQTDFINDNNGWLITEGKMGYYSDEIIYEEVKWFKPSIDNIRKVMRYVFENQDEVKKKADTLFQTTNKFTWLESAKKIIRELK